MDYLTKPPKAVRKSKGGEAMRQALQIYKDKHPNITGILIGTRRNDPHGGYISSTHTRREGVDVSPSLSPLNMSSPSVEVEEPLRTTTTSGGVEMRTGCVETGMGTQPSSTGTGNGTAEAKKGRRRPKMK
ncbi:hypothetical protein D9758_010010 [Tetrapyrgos nigripes]|uniref:Uncharacterized protein n=1 Tax=Tetrapyrgos nigripes TaxID=182062 RepID=A0A8H5FSH0_9AGAR|nr:hypothetical protein D9758_010010 [Tetrapyrgos nigripes]